jgi:hypothetical protein
MTIYFNEKRNQLVAVLSFSLALIFWLIIASYPEFFFFNPFGVANTIRSWELLAFIVAWVSISTFSPLLLMTYALGFHTVIKFLPPLVLIWPVVLVISEVTIYFQTESAYFKYLLTYPVFIFTDIFVPFLLLYTWALLARGGVKEVFSYGIRGIFRGPVNLEEK